MQSFFNFLIFLLSYYIIFEKKVQYLFITYILIHVRQI